MPFAFTLLIPYLPPTSPGLRSFCPSLALLSPSRPTHTHSKVTALLSLYSWSVSRREPVGPQPQEGRCISTRSPNQTVRSALGRRSDGGRWTTWPGKEAEPGVEPPEWLGEFGRDLQARRAACFFWATIFWTAAVGKDTGEQSVYISNQQVQRSNASLIYLMTAKPMPVQFVL